jgi:hypothetical protein
VAFRGHSWYLVVATKYHDFFVLMYEKHITFAPEME